MLKISQTQAYLSLSLCVHPGFSECTFIVCVQKGILLFAAWSFCCWLEKNLWYDHLFPSALFPEGSLHAPLLHTRLYTPTYETNYCTELCQFFLCLSRSYTLDSVPGWPFYLDVCFFFLLQTFHWLKYVCLAVSPSELALFLPGFHLIKQQECSQPLLDAFASKEEVMKYLFTWKTRSSSTKKVPSPKKPLNSGSRLDLFVLYSTFYLEIEQVGLRFAALLRYFERVFFTSSVRSWQVREMAAIFSRHWSEFLDTATTTLTTTRTTTKPPLEETFCSFSARDRFHSGKIYAIPSRLYIFPLLSSTAVGPPDGMSKAARVG